MAPLTIQDGFKVAIQHHEAGRLREAEHIYRLILAQQPEHASAIHYLGLVAHQTGRGDIALDLIRRAIALNPNMPEAHNNLGNVLKDKGDPDEAIESYRRAIALAPQHAEAHCNLGSAVRDKGQLDEAIAAYRRSIDGYHKANAVGQNCAYAHSNLVYTLHFHPDFDSNAIADEYRAWGREYGEPLRKFIQPHTNDPTPDRRLRIGYVSGDFRWHCVGRNLLPLLHRRDRSQFEIFCYAQVIRPDPLTRLLQQQSNGWRNIVGMPDEKVAEVIRRDRIDILVDLSLHTGDHRLLVFARKPAPVQATYLGYCGSSGLDTIDYRLSDPHMDPADFDLACYTERTVRLPNTYWCYQTTAETPDASRQSTDAVTFGCLNTFAKVSPAAKSLWARLLQSVPNSRLMIHTAAGSHRDAFRNFFASNGVDPARLDFIPNQGYDAYLKTYSQIDISLDPLPYGGGITTLDSLWQGVPVVTLNGRTAVGRGGRSILTNVGLPDLVAQTPDDYVRIAADLARDTDRRAELRRTLRNRMQDSPLRNAPAFARDVEAAYRRMWHSWCQTGSSQS